MAVHDLLLVLATSGYVMCTAAYIESEEDLAHRGELLAGPKGNVQSQHHGCDNPALIR